MIKKKLVPFIVSLIIFIVPFVTSTSLAVASSELNNGRTTTEFLNISPNLTVKIETEWFNDYNIVTVTDSDGNISVSDSREDYVLENNEKIEVELQESSLLYPNSNTFNGQRAAVPAWQKIRSNKITASFDKAIKDLIIGTLLAKVKSLLGYAYTAVSIVKEATHTYSLDSKNRVIRRSDTFSDNNLKKFLGY